MLNNLSIFVTPLLLLYILYRALKADLSERPQRTPPQRKPDRQGG